MNLDGEIATSRSTDFTIQRNAVRVVVPQSSNSALFDGPGAAKLAVHVKAGWLQPDNDAWVMLDQPRVTSVRISP